MAWRAFTLDGVSGGPSKFSIRAGQGSAVNSLGQPGTMDRRPPCSGLQHGVHVMSVEAFLQECTNFSRNVYFLQCTSASLELRLGQ